MNNPILWVMAVLIVVLFAVAVVMAGRSVGKREKRMKEFYRKANRQMENYEKYKDMPAEKMRNEAADDVLEGLAVSVQKQLENEVSADDAFVKLPDGQKYVYAAYYFFFDTKENLSTFFRKSGEPLLGAAVACMDRVLSDEVLSVIHAEYEMLDDNNESVSLDNQKIAEWDAQFAQFDQEALKEQVKQAILDLMD